MANKFAAALRPAKVSPSPKPDVHKGEPLASKPAAAAARPSRQGAKHVGGYFDPAVSRQLRQIAADEDSSLQELLAEAIDMLFQSRKRPTIARRQDAA